MTENKHDTENGEKKSKSSFLKSVKTMAEKLDPQLSMEDEKKSAEDSSKEKISSTKKPSSDKKPSNVSDKKTSKSSSDAKSSNDLPFIEQFHRLTDYIHQDKERIIRIGGLIIGGLFVIFGILLLFGSAEKISDNVIFGERAVTSAFLVIIGVLIVAGVLAQRIVDKTSFEGLYREVKVVEGKSSTENDKKPQNKEKKDSSSSNNSKNEKK